MRLFTSRQCALLLALLCWGLGGRAGHAQGWQSAQTIIGDDSEYLMATDAAGNVYMARSFRRNLLLSGTLVVPQDGFDALVVAKWSAATQQFEWAYRAAGIGNVYPTALAVHGRDVYVAGRFATPGGTASHISFGATELTSAGLTDGFVAKLTDAGSSADFTWATALGGSTDDAVTALTVSGNSVYVAGTFGSPTAQLGATTLHSVGTGNVFVARLLDAGATATVAWATAAGGTGTDAASALAVSNSAVYVAGSLGSTSAAFGATTLTRNPTQPLDLSDLFVARLRDDGTQATFDWALTAGGSGIDPVTTLAVAAGSVYVGGATNSRIATFGSASLVNANQQTTSFDGFVAKVNDAGTSAGFAWVAGLGGNQDDRVLGLVPTGSGDLYVAGIYSSKPLVLGATTLNNAGFQAALPQDNDIFVTRLHDQGSSRSFTWALRAGSPYPDALDCFELVGSQLVVAGIGGGYPQTFGSIVLPGVTPITYGLYVATLTDPLLAAAAPAGALRFQVLPNPARQAATVLLPAGTGLASLTIYDALGRVAHTVSLPPAASQRHELSLAGLPAGVYVVQLRAGATTGTQRLLVE